MSKQFHGLFSLGLAGAAIVIALVTAFRAAWFWGVLYLALCLAAPPIILRLYCAKCPAKLCCAHVIPGKAAAKIIRQPGAYTPTEKGWTFLILLLMFGLPQAWLWRELWALAAFWTLLAFAVVEIRMCICPACRNVYCPLNVGARG